MLGFVVGVTVLVVVEVVVVGNVEVFIAVVGTLLAVVGLGDVIGVSF